MTDLAMFSLSEEHQMIRDAARDFAQNEIASIAERRAAEFPEFSRAGDVTLGVGIESLLEKTVGEARPDLLMLLGAGCSDGDSSRARSGVIASK